MAISNDLDLYERHAADWWDPSSKAFRSLHSINGVRVEMLREWLGPRLRGARLVDLGCGGGLFADAMIASGARVVGLDLSRGSARAAHMRLGARFVQGDVLRTPFASKIADIVVLADVIEHVRPFERALAEASRLLVDGGELYVNTINRTRRARWLAVHLAEGIGLVPRGTHDADMFVSPDELTRAAAELGFHRTQLQGEAPDIPRTLRRWAVVIRRSDDLSVGYSALFRKPAAASVESRATVGSAAGARP